MADKCFSFKVARYFGSSRRKNKRDEVGYMLLKPCANSEEGFNSYGKLYSERGLYNFLDHQCSENELASICIDFSVKLDLDEETFRPKDLGELMEFLIAKYDDSMRGRWPWPIISQYRLSHSAA